MMEQTQFVEEVLRIAKTHGVDAEAYINTQNSFQASAAEGELERYEVSKSGGLGLRVNVDGRSGYAYTECYEDADTLVERALDNARSVEGGDEHPMQGPQDYPVVEPVRLKIEDMPAEERIALALELERETLAQDSRVQRVAMCLLGVASSATTICNSRGLKAARSDMVAYAYALPVAAEDGKVQSDAAFRMMDEALDVRAVAEEAVANTVGRFGAAPVPSGAYRVIIKNTAMASLLEGFVPMFSADEAQKGSSLLANREGERVGAACVTILDDPFHPVAPRAFDDEGTPCVKKRVVDQGVLTTLLHNLKTAKKADVRSTGNASRPTAASPIAVAPGVFLLEPGEGDFDALTTRLGDGLIITDLAGLHTLSHTSGDFSLEAHGVLVENGKAGRAVGDITLAGNFLSLLRDVEAVANDLRFSLPQGAFVAAPSVLVSALTVAGE